MAPLRLPAGTQVVARVPVADRTGAVRAAGSVGVVVAAEDGAEPVYRVQFPDGGDAAYLRADLIVRAEAQWAPRCRKRACGIASSCRA